MSWANSQIERGQNVSINPLGVAYYKPKQPPAGQPGLLSPSGLVLGFSFYRDYVKKYTWLLKRGDSAVLDEHDVHCISVRISLQWLPIVHLVVSVDIAHCMECTASFSMTSMLLCGRCRSMGFCTRMRYFNFAAHLLSTLVSCLQPRCISLAQPSLEEIQAGTSLSTPVVQIAMAHLFQRLGEIVATKAKVHIDFGFGTLVAKQRIVDFVVRRQSEKEPTVRVEIRETLRAHV